MQTDATTRKTRRPLLAAWLVVCALLLQPLAAAWVGPSCDAAGDCCCSSDYEAPTEATTRSSCCSAPAPVERHSEPSLQSNGCGCQMEDGAPLGPLTSAPAQLALFELSADLDSDALPLPISLAGGVVIDTDPAVPSGDARPPTLSLLVRRLQAGGLRAHLARLATLRL